MQALGPTLSCCQALDELTARLFDSWVGYVPEEVRHSTEAFFFPKEGKEDFIWHSPAGYQQCDRAVQGCAAFLGKPDPGAFTTKALRKGCAAEHTLAMK